MTQTPDGRTALYRLYDANDRLLYVGITAHPDRRWIEHALDKRGSWWSDVHRKSVQWMESRAEAEEAERLAIKTETPLKNVRHAAVGHVVDVVEHRLPPPESHLDRFELPYLRVANALARELTEARMATGGPFLTGRLIVERFGISHVTANKVLQHLASLGLIKRQGRRYVCVVLGDDLEAPEGTNGA